jgi:fructokinase
VSDSELRSLLAGAGVEAALIAADGAADLAGAAADRELAEAGLQAGWLDDAAVCHFGSDSLVSERCRRATLEAARRIKSAGGLISYDPSLSPDLWPNEAEMRREALAPVELADVLQVSERDALLLTGLEPAEAVQELLGMGVKAVVVTLGGDGCCVITRSAMTAVSAIRVKIVDASGAEDSFTGAMLYMLVKQGITAETVEAALTDEHMAGYIFSVATKAAAIASTRRGDIPALPEMAEIEAI